MPNIRRYDWVYCKDDPQKKIGFVRRVARDGSWADVKWSIGLHEWTKRMPTSSLVVTPTIRVSDGLAITDVQRKKELALAEGTSHA